MPRFFVVFVVLLLTLFTLELTHPVQNHVVIPWTTLLARISAALMGAFDADILAYGKVLQSARTGTGVSIEPGCNGVEACIILASAMLAYPASWRAKAVGLVLGVLAVQAVNVLRIITLYYLANWNTDAFNFAHYYLWQALIMIDVIVVWLLWIRWVSRHEVRHEVVPA